MTQGTDDDLDGPVAPEAEESQATEELARRENEAAVNIFDGVRGHDGDAILPVRLKPDDMFNFSCHRGVSCWNQCCHGTDITLTPYDSLRLARRFGVRMTEFVAKYTYPAEWERARLPVAKLKMSGDDGTGPCVMLDETEGCTVYEDRPATCRYYPLGLAAIKLKDTDGKEDFYFLVKESHCKGHDESKLQSVDAFRHEQGVPDYDRLNRGWIDILMKMSSWVTLGGPQGREVSDQTKQMFYMVSTDIDAFRRFVFDSRFLQIYDLDPALIERISDDDELLLQLGFDWLKNVMFNEPTIAMKDAVLQQAMAKTRSDLGGT